MSGLQVNFTDQEASSEARSFSVVPTGWYQCAIYEIEEAECGSESKNPGKPYWKVTLQCTQEGDYFKQRFWGNVMLFNGALYSLSQLMKALDYDMSAGEFEVPDIEELIGKELDASIAKIKDTYQMNKPEYDASEGTIFKNDIKGYAKLGTGGKKTLAGGKKASGSLLP